MDIEEKTILIADDMEVNRDIIKLIFEVKLWNI